MKNTMKKIAISAAACMVLSGGVSADIIDPTWFIEQGIGNMTAIVEEWKASDEKIKDMETKLRNKEKNLSSTKKAIENKNIKSTTEGLHKLESRASTVEKNIQTLTKDLKGTLNLKATTTLVGGAINAYDAGKSTGELAAKIQMGEASVRDYFNTALSDLALAPVIGPAFGFASAFNDVEQTYEATLDKKREINQNYLNMIQTEGELAKYLILNGVTDRLKNPFYSAKLANAKNADEIESIIRLAINENNQAIQNLRKSIEQDKKFIQANMKTTLWGIEVEADVMLKKTFLNSLDMYDHIASDYLKNPMTNEPLLYASTAMEIIYNNNVEKLRKVVNQIKVDFEHNQKTTKRDKVAYDMHEVETPVVLLASAKESDTMPLPIMESWSSDAYLKDALSTKVVDTTKTIETTRKLELDRLLAKHDVDIFLLADNTGSMGGLVGSAQTNAQAILDALRADSRFSKVNAQFGVGRYLGDPSEYGETATSSYQLLQPITNNDTAVTTAINQWYASGGGDWEEGNFYAIQQVIDSGAPTPRNTSLASGQVTNWRTGAQKVIVVFGDAPSWQNSVNEKELKALAIAAGAKIVFIDTSGINVGQTSNVYASTSGQQMQDAAVEIADATGGSYMRLTDVSNIQDAVLNAIYDAVADNKWTGGMVSKIDSTVWRVRTPSSVTASSDASGKILTFTLTYPNQSDSTFSINTASAAHVVGTEYYQGSISDATSIFGQDMSGASVFHADGDQDFFRYILQNGSSTVEGYYGERLSSSSKLPTSGVSSYDIRERVVSPYTKTSYASDTMKLFVNWATGKVYGFDTNALMDSAEGTAIFVGDIDRAALEISGKYTFKTRRLSASESSNLPRVIKDAMRDTTTLQLYGNAYPNGMGGTFGATYYSESGTPSLSSMMMSGYVNTKTVAKSYTPSDGEIWSGHAVGFVANRSTGAVAIDASTTTDDVQMTLKPSTGEVKASITVTDGSTNRTLTTDYTDTNVYVNQNAFVAMKDSGSVPTYAATTMSENDSYNYLSWGTWSTELSASNKTVVDGSRWIAGTLTPTTSMPSSGTATYNGTVQGMSYESGALKTLNGTHTMNANFASGTITGTMNVNYASIGASYATTNLNAVSISGNGFAGGLNGTDNTGSIKGSFYGPAANEIGGTWALSKTGSSAAGIFAGKK